MRIITRTIWILSLVSLMTDVASEMLYPVLPVYLRHIGFSIALIGLLEGIAEATAGLSKGYFGHLSDRTGRRLPFVQLGYLLSSIAKPLIIAFAWPMWVFFARTLDRLGKGIRTSARDALLSDEANPSTKGRVFGFHRAMDTFGAFLGPALALIYLWFAPEAYESLFLLAIIPGLIAVALTFMLRERRRMEMPIRRSKGFFGFLAYWRSAPPAFRKVAVGLLIFSLFNSSDIFLLLRLKESGLDDRMVIGTFMFYNLVYAVFAYPLGVMADRIGLRTMYILGLGIFAIVYAGMALLDGVWLFSILFFGYGVYAAATEGISKAWISNLARREDTATAIGFYSAFQSISLLLASTITGIVWHTWGSRTAFLISALAALSIAIYFSLWREPALAGIENPGPPLDAG